MILTSHKADEGSFAAAPARRSVAVVLSVVKTRWGLRPHAPAELCDSVRHAGLARREARRRTFACVQTYMPKHTTSAPL